jgi:hypothetical protein
LGHSTATTHCGMVAQGEIARVSRCKCQQVTLVRSQAHSRCINATFKLFVPIMTPCRCSRVPVKAACLGWGHSDGCPGVQSCLQKSRVPLSNRTWRENTLRPAQFTIPPRDHHSQPLLPLLTGDRMSTEKVSICDRVSCSNCEALAKTSPTSLIRAFWRSIAGRCPDPGGWPNRSGCSNPSAATWQDRLAPPGPGGRCPISSSLTRR